MLSCPFRLRFPDPRFTAEKDDGATRHIVAKTSLKTLLDRLDEIEASRSGRHQTGPHPRRPGPVPRPNPHRRSPGG